MPISEAERNYEPRNWIEVGDLPEIVRPMGPALGFYVCNSDSGRFQQLIREGIGHKAFLIDYELLSLDIDPICGSSIQVTAFDKIIMMVYTAEGNRLFIES